MNRLKRLLKEREFQSFLFLLGVALLFWFATPYLVFLPDFLKTTENRLLIIFSLAILWALSILFSLQITQSSNPPASLKKSLHSGKKTLSAPFKFFKKIIQILWLALCFPFVCLFRAVRFIWRKIKQATVSLFRGIKKCIRVFGQKTKQTVTFFIRLLQKMIVKSFRGIKKCIQVFGQKTKQVIIFLIRLLRKAILTLFRGIKTALRFFLSLFLRSSEKIGHGVFKSVAKTAYSGKKVHQVSKHSWHKFRAIPFKKPFVYAGRLIKRAIKKIFSQLKLSIIRVKNILKRLLQLICNTTQKTYQKIKALCLQLKSKWPRRKERKKEAIQEPLDLVSSDDVVQDSLDVEKSFEQATQFLKNKNAQQLPFYLVLGPSMAGKTHLLAHSGLSFAETERFAQLVPQGMQTLNSLNWWFTQRAVFIDVPGRYLSLSQITDTARAAWLTLLRLLLKYRRRQSLHGIILTIDCQTLLMPQEKQADYWQQLRAQIQEVYRRLKQTVPIYLVCTKMDSLQGFQEYFADLGTSERQQPWGITFPESSTLRSEKLFVQEWRSLLKRLHERALWRMHQERQTQKRARIKDFPLQLGQLQESLTRLVYAINVVPHASWLALRGVYFTSTHTTDKATDVIDEAIEKNFGTTHPKTQHLLRMGQPYFIKQLFEQVIFQEIRPLQDKFHRLHWHHTARPRTIALVSGLVLLMGTTIWWAHDYRRQTADLTQATQALSDYKMLIATYNSQDPHLHQLLPALNALLLAQQLTQHAHLPWLLRLQMHQQQNLVTLTHTLYARHLQGLFIPALQENLLQQLSNQIGSDPNTLYQTLQIYLMLSEPAHSNNEMILHWFKTVWLQQNPQDAQVIVHLQNALHVGLLPQAANPTAQTIIAQVRAQLDQLPDNTLAGILLENNLPAHAIESAKNYPLFSLPTSGIDALYTQKELATINQLIAAIPQQLQGNWVLGNRTTTTTNNAALLSALQNDYANDYITAWQNWLNNVQLKSWENLSVADRALQKLDASQSPLIEILDIVKTNTTIQTNPWQALINPAFGNIDQTLGMQPQIVASLKKLQQLIHHINNAKNPNIAALAAAKTIFTQNNNPIDNLLLLAQQTPAPVQQWLNQIALNSWQLIMQKARQGIIEQWQQSVLPSCKQNVEGHFPFDQNSTNDISLNAFTALFGPNGKIPQFFNQTLAPFVDTTQTQWQWRQHDGLVFQFNTNALMQFERAAIIQKMFFHADHHDQLGFNFTAQQQLTSPPTTKVTLTGIPSPWPDARMPNLSLTFKTAHGKTYYANYSGDWALFHWLAASKINASPNNKQFTLAYNTHHQTVIYQLTTNNPTNPLIPNITNQFTCPLF